MKILFTASLLGAAATPAAGQVSSQLITIHWPTGDQYQDGYTAAKMQVAYKFASCADRLVVSVGSKPSTLEVGGGYWYKGRHYTLAGDLSVSPPEVGSAHLSSPVYRGGASIGSISRTVYARSSAGCLMGDNTDLASMDDHLPKPRTSEQVSAFLATLRLENMGREQAPLRNSRVEEVIERRLRAEAEREKERAAERAAAEQKKAEEAAAHRKAEEEEVARRAEEKASQERASAHQAGATGAATAASGEQNRTERRLVDAPPGVDAQYVRTTNGGFYRRTADGRYEEISETEYQASKERDRREREASEVKAEREQAEAAVRAVEEQQRRAAEAERRRQEQAEEIGEAVTEMAKMAHAAGMYFGGYLFSMENGTSSWMSPFASMTGYGVSLAGRHIFFGGGLLEATYADPFREEYNEENTYLDPLEAETTGFFMNGGLALMLPETELGFTAGGMYAITYEAHMYAATLGAVAGGGGFQLRGDLGIDLSNGGGTFYGLGLYINMGD